MSQLARAMTEEMLLQAITEAATYYGWRWHHVRRSDKALQMGHAGFPDLVLARNGRVLFLELKAASGRETPDQKAWIDALNDYDDESQAMAAFVIYPHRLDAVLAMLE